MLSPAAEQKEPVGVVAETAGEAAARERRERGRRFEREPD